MLLAEAVEALQVRPGKWYVDATLGGGGHTRAILDCGGKVLGVDHDRRAIERATHELEKEIKRGNVIVRKANFVEMSMLTKREHLPISGILFDLGMSSLQLAEKRGFSFVDETLDMRMDEELGVTAKDLVNVLSQEELKMLFRRYGEETRAGSVAARIVDARKKRPIRAARELAQIISENRSVRGLHPATKVFQALRIAVNDELNNLRKALPQAIELVQPGGRVVVISFHSLEDRIVKQCFRSYSDSGKASILTKKPVLPSQSEVAENPRSRSAKLRVAERRLEPEGAHA